MSDAVETDADPDEVARASAEAMEAQDRAGAGLGLHLLDIGPGYATVAMTVTESMTDGQGQAHGGFVFLLAESAFAFACNSRGEKAAAQHGQISFLRPGHLGDRLVATAHEVYREGCGIYDVNVSAGDETVAEFRGQSRNIGGRWV